MENLTLLTDQLKSYLFNVTDNKDRKNIIYRHISDVEKENFFFPDFPLGLDWFNVSRPLDDSSLRGKIVVVDFFTYCCINCLHLIPHLRKLEHQHSVHDGLVVVGVHSAKFDNEKDSDNILLALKRHNISHPVVNDSECQLWNKLGVICWPTILIIGPNGKILFVLVGEGHQEELFLFVKTTLDYYSSLLSSHSLSLIQSDRIVTSNLLGFPSKITKWKELFAVSDSGNHRILIFDSTGRIKFRIGGTKSGFKDGSFKEARFNLPQGLAFYDSSTLYIADTENHAIRLACLKKETVVTIIGNGNQGYDYVGGKIGTQQEISSPWDLCIVPCPSSQLPQSSLFTFGSSGNSSSSFPQASPSLSPYADDLPPSLSPSQNAIKDSPVFSPRFPISLNTNSSSNVPSSLNFTPPPPPPPPPPISGLAKTSGPPASPLPSNKSQCCANSDAEKYTTGSQVLLIAAAGTHQIWALFLEEGHWWKSTKYEKHVCLSIAGTGKEGNRNNHYPKLASFAQPSGLTYSPELNVVFIADSESSSIRNLSMEDGSVSHVVGGSQSPDDLFSYGDADGRKYDVKLQHPLAVAWNSHDNLLYVCDTYNHKIKVVDVEKRTCSAILKDPNLFSEPSGCCVSECGTLLYVCDTNNSQIKTVDLKENKVTIIELKEESDDGWSAGSASSDHEAWQWETVLSEEKSSLKLKIQFDPGEIHGKWRLVVNEGNVVVDSSKGTLKDSTFNIDLGFPPLAEEKEEKNGDENYIFFQIFFDLVLCTTDSCNFKKIALNVSVQRRRNAETEVVGSLTKNLL